jgi:hypothetical protein
MGQSWSKMRNQLEQHYICETLKRHVAFFITRYPKASDTHTRIAVRVDGNEVLKSDFIKWRKASCETSDDNLIHNLGGFDAVEFYTAFYKYQNNSIENSLYDDDPLVRLLAILDKRVGKRRIQKLLLAIKEQPTWLQYFYNLRKEAERIG